MEQTIKERMKIGFFRKKSVPEHPVIFLLKYFIQFSWYFILEHSIFMHKLKKVFKFYR